MVNTEQTENTTTTTTTMMLMDMDGTKQPSNVSMEERPITKERLDRPLQLGDHWYVISSSWMTQWEQHVHSNVDGDVDGDGGGVSDLGPIDNDQLLDSASEENQSPVLKKYIQELKDYHLVPEDVWIQLKHTYGGGPEIRRDVIDKNGRGSLGIDLFPYFLQVAHHTRNKPSTVRMKDNYDDDDDDDLSRVDDSSDDEYQQVDNIKLNFRQVVVSGKSTLEQLLDHLNDAFDLHVSSSKDDLRLWKCFRSNPYKLVREIADNSDDSDDEYEITVESLFPDAQIGCKLVVETKDSNGAWPLGHDEKPKKKVYQASASRFHGFNSSSSLSSSLGTTYSYPEGNSHRSPPGVCGLSNLGNTCFMNSALQCLTKTPSIQKYFTSDEYRAEINRQNPLGMHGKVASAFGNLMKSMWSGQHSSISPRTFKQTIGEFAPQFSGYQQQDSQELMAYLLDGLHEDLNRIKNKPTTSQVESNGRPDAEVAEEAWKIHKKRNDSIIVDLFQGQLKSTLVCPQEACITTNKVSVTFDPFMYLSLPLPVEKTTIPVTYFPYGDDKKPIKLAVTVNQNGKIREMREAISRIVAVDNSSSPNDIVIADMYDHKVHKFLLDYSSIEYIRDNDIIYAYEVPGLDETCHQSSSQFSPSFASVNFVISSESKNILDPFVVKIESGITTAREIYDRTLEHIKIFVDPTRLDKFKSLFYDHFPKREMENDTMDEGEEEEEEEERGETDLDTTKNVQMQDDESITERPMIELRARETLIPYGDDVIAEDRYKLSIPSSLVDLLNIDDRNVDPMMHDSLDDTKKRVATLDDCLNLFTIEEKLGAQDTWYCPHCKEFVQATKKFDIWALPEILVVHLKRFQYDGRWREKLNTFVDFPIEELDMTPHVPKESVPHQRHLKYELFAVSNHMGGLGGGHYTAYAKINDSGKWYLFDDSFTRETNESSIRSSSAYLLFYRSKNISTGM